MAEFAFKPMPHEAAMKLLADKPVVTRQVFDRLLPELQGRAFTMTGIEDAATLQRLKDTLSKLPEGRPWDEVKGDVLDEISPWIDAEQAPIRAELLMRHNGFQAYMAAKHENMSEMKDVMPYWQYITMEDEAVRDSHQALNGLVMPADSPFWADHTPPWDWGCRCELVPLMDYEVSEIEAGQDLDDRNSEGTAGWVPGPAEQRAIERDGRVSLGPSHVVDVTAPRKRAGNERGTFGWNPGDMRVSLEDLREQYDPVVFGAFEAYAKRTRLEDGRALWQWLEEGGA
jgi:SPP1 gp7 family putative phage head morphogenesis protein